MSGLSWTDAHTSLEDALDIGALEHRLFDAIDESKHSSSITLYPNPVSQALNIRGLPNESLDIILIDLNGRVHQHLQMTPSLPGFTVNLTGITNGMYILTAFGSAGNIILRQKVVVQR